MYYRGKILNFYKIRIYHFVGVHTYKVKLKGASQLLVTEVLLIN